MGSNFEYYGTNANRNNLVDLKKARNYINYIIKLVEEQPQKKTQPKRNNSKLKYSKWPIRFGVRPNWNIDVMLKEFTPEQVKEIIGRKAWDELNKKKKKKPANVIDFKKDPKK